ncbi:MAG: ABC transporter permease subunit [Candidatus Sulfopaludibacter sp.]|nr:ABC transporter permease subunit [Candidatus Sulfopaludibacter sp.]
MKVRAIAANTFNSLLRNKIIIVFSAGMVCVMLLALTPLMLARNNRAIGADQMQAMVLQIIGGIMSMVSGFGSLLAAWAAADAVSGEMRTGTILAVMARPVRRWEYLLGKYLGVQLLMVAFVFGMLALNYAMAAIGGVHIQISPWLLIVYPLVRYAVFSAIALMLVTVMHPMIACGIVLVMSIAAQIVAPSAAPPQFMAPWVRKTLFDILPSTSALSEIRFLTVTRATLRVAPWTDHVITLAYGLDYALVCFLVGAWLFRNRTLSRD